MGACSGWFVSVMTLFCLVHVPSGSTASKILLLGHGFPSQLFIVHEIGAELSRRGHEVVTVLGSHMKDQPIPLEGGNIVWYRTPDGAMTLASTDTKKQLGDIIMSGEPHRQHVLFSAIALSECYNLESDQDAMKQISEIGFDIAIVGIFPLSYCFTFLPLKLSIPFVVASPTLEAEVFRSPMLPSFVPQTFALSSDDMTFTERLRNIRDYIYYFNPNFCPFAAITDVTLLERHAPHSDIQSWADAARLASLVLYTRGHLSDWPIPTLPHIINVEGLTARPARALPEYLADRLETTQHGVVVVSFGSALHLLPDFVIGKFLDAFRRRKELFVMGYTQREGMDVPENVIMIPWVPQTDLLGHPKVQLFITHGGLGSFHEAMYNGVPILTVPMFAEQHHNAHKNKAKGYGLSIDIRTFTPEELEGKIALMIENRSFIEEVEKVSRIWRSRPMNARDTAAYWVEHVLEFGDNHLRSHALNMPWYSLYMIDILAFLLLVAILTCGFLLFVCYCIFRRIRQPHVVIKYKTR